MVGKSISTRIDRIFPSSMSLSALYALPKEHQLPTGETYTHVCLTSFSQRSGVGIERGTSILFSKGASPEGLCSLRMAVHFTPDGSLEMIHETRKSSDISGNWSMDVQTFFADPDRTESWKFQAAEDRVASILDLLRGVMPDRLPGTHPMLNSLGIRKAFLAR